jgi:hypothetical protein
MNLLPALTLALSGAVVAVAAPAPDPPDLSPEARAPFPRVESAGGIDYLNGGASLAEADYVKSRAREFALELLFSGKGGEYGVADRVTVRQGEREIVSVPDAGPYLLLSLAPGRYSIEAEFDGQVEKRSVSVGKGHQTVNWNTPKASDPG